MQVVESLDVLIKKVIILSRHFVLTSFSNFNTELSYTESEAIVSNFDT